MKHTSKILFIFSAIFSLVFQQTIFARLVFTTEEPERQGNAFVLDVLNEFSDIDLKFGENIDARIRFDRVLDVFTLNRSLSVAGNISLSGQIIDSDGNTGTSSQMLVSDGAGKNIWQTVAGLSDPVVQTIVAGAPALPSLATITANLGSITRHRFDGISGNAVSDLTGSANYPDAPDIDTTETIFEIPLDASNSYGSRVYGYIVAPQTGNYTFWIASDDGSELYLSTDNDPANKALIASVVGWTSSRQWTKYASQQSVSIPLVAGQAYYIEALHKEGSGGDNLAVGWQLPDSTLERPIPGSRIAPYITSAFNATVNSDSDVVLVDTTNAPVNLELPAYSGDIKDITIKKTLDDARDIIISPSSGELLEGSGSSFIIPGVNKRSAIRLQTDGTNIHVVGTY